MPLVADKARELERLAQQYAAVQESSKEGLLSKLNALGQARGIRFRDYEGGLLIVVPEDRMRLPWGLQHIASVIIVEDECGRCLEVLKDRSGDYPLASFEGLSSWERLLGDDLV